jgi:hypothetical protein
MQLDHWEEDEMYYIKNIKITTANGVTSVLPLKNGLNIIYGPSNTGKSLVLDCIDFLMGSKGRNEKNRSEESISYKRLSKPELKISSIALSIDVNGKEVQLTRNIDSADISVVSNVDTISSGTYSLKGSKKKPPIYKVWLALLGIEDDVQIVMKADGSPQGLTLRTFYHTFLINESRIVAENSVMKNGTGYNKNIPVPTVSALVYLAANKTYALPKKDDVTAVISAKKSTALQMYDRSVNALAERKFVAMIETDDVRSVAEIKADIDILLAEISAAEDVLNQATETSRELASHISDIDDKLAECKMLKNRYTSLRTQYESDIRRLTFIAEGDSHKSIIPQVEHCPFCNGELKKQQSKSCIDAAVSEVKKIEIKINDLRSADSKIDREEAALTEKRNKLVSERQEVQSLIRGELKPKVETLRTKMVSYTAALERAKAAEMVEAFTKILKEQYETLTADTEPKIEKPKFNVLSVIDEHLTKPLSTLLETILKECNYYNYVDARFENSLCDIVVNGSDKMSQGKGFRAFLNSVMAIAIQEWLINCNVYPPHLLVMDSPILSLKEREENVGTQVTSNSMRKGLFLYMVKHQQNRQTIILENEIPGINYDSANLIHFTGKDGDGIYGLISEYRE